MDLLIKNAKIIDRTSSFHLKQTDVLIKGGKIEKINPSIDGKSIKTIEAKGLHLSKGWIDLNVNYQDPGDEQKENFKTGLSASAAGGFTRVCVAPNTYPTRDSKSQIEYLINQTKGNIVDAMPYGAISKNCEGKELAELNDMKQSGAIAFSDGKLSIKNPNLLYRALRYTKAFDGLVVNFPNTAALCEEGVMNEGATSTRLGLKGIPEVAEVMMVNRDLYLLAYAEGRLHFATISSPESLQLIKKAKKDGLKVSCDVASYNLLLSDEELVEFDSRFKTLPPLRSKSSIKQLIKGIKDGLVDAICSDHLPEDIEQKKKELDYAAFGIINAQTAFSCAHTALENHISIEALIELFTEGPASILKLKTPSIEVGEAANLTLFSPSEKFIFSKDQVLSKSFNSPFFGMELKGKVLGVINNKQVFLNK